MQNLGFTVTVKAASASTSADATGKKLVFVAESVGSSDVGTKFRTVTTPLVICEPFVYYDCGMTATTANTDYGTATSQTQVTITAVCEAIPGEEHRI